MRRQERGDPAAAATVRHWVPFSILWLCHTGTFFAFSASMPFLPLYLQEIGVEDRADAAAWAGAIGAVSMIVFAGMNVFWGAMADRAGMKLGLVRSLFLATAGLIVSGVAQSPEHLLIGRLIHSVGGGANSAALTLASSILPAAQLGLGVGLLQTGQSLGGALGPVVGGLIGDAQGFRAAFFVSAAITATVAVVVTGFVREPARRTRSSSTRFVEGVAYVAGTPALRNMIALTFLFQSGYSTAWAFIPLRIQDLVPGESVGSWSGTAMMADALGLALGATFFGWLTTRLSAHPIMLAAVVTTLVATVCHVLTTSVYVLVGLRFVIGLGAGAVLPIARAQLGTQAAPGRQGITIGIGQSAFASAWGLGSLAGSLAIGAWGILGAFILSAAILAVTTVWAIVVARRAELSSGTP